MAYSTECLVVGAGVIGLAIAREFQLAGHETFLIDRATSFGTETSSRNSEVIHAGIYYPAGSLKALHCVQGRRLLYAYCEARGVPHSRIGKIIVAATEEEVGALDRYRASAIANGVQDLSPLSTQELARLEPNVRGVAGLLSPSTGIIDSHSLMLALLHDFQMAGGHFVPSCEMTEAGPDSENHIRVLLNDGTEITTRWLINSAGHSAPAIAQTVTGFPAQCVPQSYFAIGHYYVLNAPSPFSHLVYPIAPPGALGVHVTMDMGGQVKFGPDIRWIDALDYRFDDGRRAAFVEAIQAYYPDLDPELLSEGYTGIRPKIADATTPDTDFVMQTEREHGVKGLVNLFGIESPGLTASLSLAKTVTSFAQR